MKITIKDCFRLPAFENAVILAGQNKLDTIFKRVTVLEESKAADIDETNIEKNVMVITGFFSVRDDVDEQCKMIEKSVHCGMTILVIHRIGDIIKDVDPKVVSLCKKLGIVLIALDKNRKIQTFEIIDEVTQLLFYGREDGFGQGRLIDIAFELINFDKYSSFEEALTDAAKSYNFQFVLMSQEFNQVLTIETRYITSVEAAINLAREKEMAKRAGIHTMIDVDGVLTYWGIVVLGGSEYYMFIVDNDDSYSEEDIIKLSTLITMSMGMWQYEPSKDLDSELIKELKRGNNAVAHSIKNDMKIDEKDFRSVFFCKGLMESGCRDIWNKYCSDNNIDSYMIRGLSESNGLLVSKEAVPLVVALYDEVKSKRDTKIFHVSGISGIEDASEGFTLIGETWQAAEKIFPFKRNFSKYDLTMVKNCITINEIGGFVKRSFTKIWEPFNEEKSAKGRELLRTLETFVLDANMSLQKTAEILNMHTNTIQYRMKRISDILGVEITASRAIPGITTATAIRRLDRESI